MPIPKENNVVKKATPKGWGQVGGGTIAAPTRYNPNPKAKPVISSDMAPPPYQPGGAQLPQPYGGIQSRFNPLGTPAARPANVPAQAQTPSWISKYISRLNDPLLRPTGIGNEKMVPMFPPLGIGLGTAAGVPESGGGAMFPPLALLESFRNPMNLLPPPPTAPTGGGYGGLGSRYRRGGGGGGYSGYGASSNPWADYLAKMGLNTWNID